MLNAFQKVEMSVGALGHSEDLSNTGEMMSKSLNQNDGTLNESKIYIPLFSFRCMMINCCFFFFASNNLFSSQAGPRVCLGKAMAYLESKLFNCGALTN